MRVAKERELFEEALKKAVLDEAQKEGLEVECTTEGGGLSFALQDPKK